MTRTNSYRVLAIILIAVGVYALAVELNLITWGFIGDIFGDFGHSVGQFFGDFGRTIGRFFADINWDAIWPLALVALGAGLLLRRPTAKAKHTA